MVVFIGWRVNSTMESQSKLDKSGELTPQWNPRANWTNHPNPWISLPSCWNHASVNSLRLRFGLTMVLGKFLRDTDSIQMCESSWCSCPGVQYHRRSKPVSVSQRFLPLRHLISLLLSTFWHVLWQQRLGSCKKDTDLFMWSKSCIDHKTPLPSYKDEILHFCEVILTLYEERRTLA